MTNLPAIGFIGLGEMGGPMARNLIRAGYEVMGYDLDPARLAQAVADGAHAGADVAAVVQYCDVIATSLPSSSAWVTTAEDEILPHARAGQIVIDFGTVTPPETRRLAARFAEKEIELIDAPVSGGGSGAQQAKLYVFVGGERATVERCLPILQTVGGPDRITYCGPAGSGQVVKGVNQLMMGLVDAAYLEAISFGVNEGIDIEIIQQAIGGEGRWRADFSRIAQRIAGGNGNNVGVKYRELPYFLYAAEEAGFALPITKSVREFCEKGDYIVIDDHRAAPSYWHELTHK
jgi:3-hydroxyisobutyrate dehydrogenase-like beta-hydroxyacid dehydrogenase